jgi:putative aldouronate transport system substrate-binding protein
MSIRRLTLLVSLLALLLLVGAVSAQETLAPVDLDYYYIGWPVTDLQMVEDAVNAIVTPEINATVHLHVIDWSSYTDRMQVMIASGEQCDIMLADRGQWNNYSTAVANGGLKPLDDLLPEYAPHLWADIPQATWDASRVNGQIYGVPGRGNPVVAYGAWVRQDLMEKYDFDWTQAHSYPDMEPLYDAIVAGEPDVTPILSTDGGPHGTLWFPEAWGFDPLGSPQGVIGVRVNAEGDPEVVATVDTPEYAEAINLTRDWYNRGYFTTDPLPDGDMQTDRSAGKYSTMVWSMAPGYEDLVAQNEWGGRSIVMLQLAPGIETTGTVTGSFNGICATSPNPERALMFLDLLNTNAELYNTMVWGIEGTHWVWDADQQYVTVPEGKTPDEVNAAYRGPEWVFGNQSLKYPISAAEAARIDAWGQMAESATLSPALGFTADYTGIATEMAQITSAYQQYGEPLQKGLVDPETALPEYQARLHEAGIDTVVEEIQSQLDAWRAAQAS